MMQNKMATLPGGGYATYSYNYRLLRQLINVTAKQNESFFLTRVSSLFLGLASRHVLLMLGLLYETDLFVLFSSRKHYTEELSSAVVTSSHENEEEMIFLFLK